MNSVYKRYGVVEFLYLGICFIGKASSILRKIDRILELELLVCRSLFFHHQVQLVFFLKFLSLSFFLASFPFVHLVCWSSRLILSCPTTQTGNCQYYSCLKSVRLSRILPDIPLLHWLSIHSRDRSNAAHAYFLPDPFIQHSPHTHGNCLIRFLAEMDLLPI